MTTHHYVKCNAQANFGFRDLIFQVLTTAGRPMLSVEIYEAAEKNGMLALLYANRPMPETPWATLYARLSEEAKKPNGFVRRKQSTRVSGYLYELVPGRSPSGRGRKLDYTSRNCEVYALKNETTGQVFYVGMGMKGRKNCHLVGASHSKLVTRAVEEIRLKGHTPVSIVLKGNLTRTEARRFESVYIDQFGRRDTSLSGTLLNQKA
jgi:hypothetical protein